MRLEPLALDGAYLLIQEPVTDERGFFARTFDASQLASAGLVTEFPQWSVSFSFRRGTLRGLHWQQAPYLETKLVQCTAGAVYDVIVDLRRASPDFGKWVAVTLSAENRQMLYVPAGFGHGFQTLQDNSEFYYHISEPYRAESARGVRWNDPDLAIEWPAAEHRILSERDKNLPTLSVIGAAD